MQPTTNIVGNLLQFFIEEIDKIVAQPFCLRWSRIRRTIVIMQQLFRHSPQRSLVTISLRQPTVVERSSGRVDFSIGDATRSTISDLISFLSSSFPTSFE